MLKVKYPYTRTVNAIRKGRFKIKPDPCSRCVSKSTCRKYNALEDICDRKIDYDNFQNWIYDPDGIFYQCEVSRGSMKYVFIQFCGESHDSLWEYAVSENLDLCRQADKAYKKYLLEEFIIWDLDK